MKTTWLTGDPRMAELLLQFYLRAGRNRWCSNGTWHGPDSVVPAELPPLHFKGFPRMRHHGS